MKKFIIAAVLGLALVAGSNANAATFSSYLKVGSTGSEVTELQTWLVSEGFLTIPAGTAKGYFGQLTKAAVVAWQASVGLPATGYFGPMSVAYANANSGTTVVVTPGCPAGALFNATTGASCTTPTTPGCAAGALFNSSTGQSCTATPVVAGCAIGAAFSSTSGLPCRDTGVQTSSGIEGTLTVDQGAISNTTIYEGQLNVPVLNLRLRAVGSNINVQRVQVNLGSDSDVYTKAFSKLSVIGDNGQVLMSMPLSSLTVTKTGSNYYTTINGFSYVVPANSYRNLTIAADVNPSVNTTFQGNYTFALPSNGVRGVDGAGIDQYAVSGFSQTVTIATSLIDSATLKLSTNSATPANGVVIANSGSNSDQADKVTVLVFDLKAEKDSVGITDLLASTTINGVAANATTTSAYLYDGTTLIASTAVASNGTISFTNIAGVQGYVIPKDTIKSFTLKVDFRNASAVSVNSTTTILANGISAVNSQGSSVSSVTGSAVSNTLAVQKAGPVLTLVGTPTLSKTVIGQTASSTFLASFTFDLAAQGTTASVEATGAFNVGIYVNNVRVATTSAVYAKPVTGVTGNGPYIIADGSSARFVAEYSFIAPAGVYIPAGAIVSARLESATVNGVTGSTHVSDTFRTNSSTL